jgi:hypothetical protein
VWKVFGCIYFPVWCDQYGTKKGKTLWMSILQISVMIGVVLGYGLAAIFVSIKASYVSNDLNVV